MTLRFHADPTQARALAAWNAVTGGDWAFFVVKGPLELHNRQRGVCYLCPAGFERGEAYRNPLHRTRDHVFPRTTGGRAGGNILLAHRRCNEEKGPRWPYPCEVIYLAAIYAPPHDAAQHRLAMVERRAARRLKRLAVIERYA